MFPGLSFKSANPLLHLEFKRRAGQNVRVLHTTYVRVTLSHSTPYNEQDAPISLALAVQRTPRHRIVKSTVHWANNCPLHHLSPAPQRAPRRGTNGYRATLNS